MEPITLVLNVEIRSHGRTNRLKVSLDPGSHALEHLSEGSTVHANNLLALVRGQARDQ
jgi:hypothetical protein